jgi:hypothetical protein
MRLSARNQLTGTVATIDIGVVAPPYRALFSVLDGDREKIYNRRFDDAVRTHDRSRVSPANTRILP